MSADATTLVRQEWEEGDRRLEAERGDRAPLRAPARAGRDRHRGAAQAASARRTRSRSSRTPTATPSAGRARPSRSARPSSGLAPRPRPRPRRRVPRATSAAPSTTSRDRAGRAAPAAPRAGRGRSSGSLALARGVVLFGVGIALGEALHDNPKPEFDGYNARKRSCRERRVVYKAEALGRFPPMAHRDDSEWLTLGQAARFLGVAQSTIRKWSDHGPRAGVLHAGRPPALPALRPRVVPRPLRPRRQAAAPARSSCSSTTTTRCASSSASTSSSRATRSARPAARRRASTRSRRRSPTSCFST